jgi:hypothetical protein
MSDQRIRLVSGEIIVSDVVVADEARLGRCRDVVDAEFETLRPNADERLVPSASSASIGTSAAPSLGLDSLRKGSAPVQQARSRGGPLFWLTGVGLAAGAFWVSGGHALVRETALMPLAPQTQPANPMRIRDVTSRIEQHGERDILFVDGKALNEGSLEQMLEPIEISVIANDGHVMRYIMGTAQDPIAAGGEFSFSSRLEAPKEGVRSVTVAFRE